jgi:outer membrane protein assembly factor BamB
VVNQALAKRLPPPILLPVDDGIYRFVVFNEPPDHGHNPYQGGHVAAYLKATGEKIWEKYVFRIWVDSHKEMDTQDIYLKKMYLDKSNLLVLQNERGDWFVLDRRTGDYLKTQKFKKLEDDPSVYYIDGTRIEPILKGTYFIQADNEVSYGHQKVRAYDLPTGKLLWEKKVQVPRNGDNGRSPISFMVLNDDGQLEITFEDGSESRLDVRTGKCVKNEEKKSVLE